MADGSKMKVALVTGASSGIGRSFAIALAEQGENVFLVARREERLKELAGKLTDRFAVKADYLPLDLTQPDSRRQLYDEVARRSYEVETLVNNAGFGIVGRFDETDLALSMQMMQLNVAALIELSGLYLPQMTARGSGNLINISSTAGFQPLAGMALYGATKSLVFEFTVALWAELKNSGVRVLAVCPGYTESEFGAVAGELSHGASNNPMGGERSRRGGW